IDEVNSIGIENIFTHGQELMALFLEKMKRIKGMTSYGPTQLANRVAVIPFQSSHINSHELAIILDEHYKIAVRAGVHCAPKIHESLATCEEGLVRVSFGPYNTSAEVNALIQALTEIEQAFE